MGIKASCHFHLTAKLDVYHSLSCLLPSFLSLARGPQRITQERPVGHSSQTALLLQSTASESETWLNLATHLLTAFSGFMIKMFSPDKWGRVTFPAVSLLMLLIHFTRRLISNVTMNEGEKKPKQVLNWPSKYICRYLLKYLRRICCYRLFFGSWHCFFFKTNQSMNNGNNVWP